MNTVTVKEQYWKYSLITIILGIGLISFLKLSPFMGGILGACTLYIMLRGQMIYLTQRKRLSRSVVSTLLVLETIVCLLVPLALMTWLMINKWQSLDMDTDSIVQTVRHLSERIEQYTGYKLSAKENLTSLASVIPDAGQFLMGSISNFALNAFVLVFVLYFMLTGGRKMEQYIYDLLPFSRQNKQEVLREINMIVRSNAIGIPLLALIQGGIATLGYYLFHAPSPLLFGALTSFATLLPIVGTALVWLPLAGFLSMSGHWPQAIGLLLYCGIIVTNIDNLVRFILQKRMADTHPLITIFGVVIGLPLFGFMGVIFGPLLLSLFLLCLHIFKTQYLK